MAHQAERMARVVSPYEQYRASSGYSLSSLASPCRQPAGLARLDSSGPPLGREFTQIGKVLHLPRCQYLFLSFLALMALSTPTEDFVEDNSGFLALQFFVKHSRA